MFENDIRFQALLTLQKLFIISWTEYIARSDQDSIFNFLYSLKLSFQDIHKIFQEDIGHRYIINYEFYIKYIIYGLLGGKLVLKWNKKIL